MTINPVVLGLLIALAVMPWLILTVHMYVYHWRHRKTVEIYDAKAQSLEDFSRYGCLPGWNEPDDGPF